MTSYQMKWFTNSQLLTLHQQYSCRQVYVWLMSGDSQAVLVSKDGKKWQFPGGKPETGEAHEQTAVREVREETGLDISRYAHNLEFFGYYVVEEVEGNLVKDTYLQVRYLLRLPETADKYTLHAGEEDFTQVSEDIIHFAEFVSLDELGKRVEWLPASEEYAACLAHLDR